MPSRAVQVTPGRLHAITALALLAVLSTVPASAFPPYRSTDAGTADPWMFEARLGMLRLRRDRDDSVYSSPLLRLNLGLPHAVELITELEVRPWNGGLSDVALGAKWVPVRGRWSLGTETLLLLPVPNAPGIGVESQLVVTYRDHAQRLRLHLNGGAFYDGRVDAAEKGWRASALAEFKSGRYRPGLEVFARKIGAAPVEVLAGPGVIVDVGRLDIRLGVHVGLTAAAPDVVLDAWTSAALYKVEGGKRTDLKPKGAGLFAYGKKANLAAGTWGLLRVIVRGNRFDVYLGSDKLLEVEDSTFAGIGKVGLWTKADSVTYFDDLRVEVR